MESSSLNYRAFSRNFSEAPIVYAFHNTEKYYTAKMCNCSEGGMYFESEHNTLKRGTDIWIKMVNSSPDLHGTAVQDGYRAEVVWCRRISDREASPYYGVGVRFMVNTCDRCGAKVSHKEIHKTDNLVFLCSKCLEDLNSLPGGKIRSSVENYLMGNVL